MDAGQDLPSVLSRLAVLEKQLNGVLENGIVAAEKKDRQQYTKIHCKH